MKNRWILFVTVGVVALASPQLFAQGVSRDSAAESLSKQEAESLAQEAARKSELADAIVAARQTASGRDLGARFRASLKQSLLSLSVERLEAFLNAGGLGDIEAAVRETVSPSALGDAAADLAFTPVAPCRVVDTRSAAAGLLVAGAPQSFLVRNAGGFATQGGSATDCGISATATAVEMNYVAVGPAGPGDLRAFAFGGTLPNASVINYSNLSGLNIANGIAQPVCNPATTTCTKDLTVQADVANTHLIIDVVGYYNKIDGSVLTRAIAAHSAVNSTTTPVTNNLIAGVVAPTVGGLLVNFAFNCASNTGTVDTEWFIQPRIDTVANGSASVLFFKHTAKVARPGDNTSGTLFAPVAAGTHAISYTATRTAGDGSLDCNLHASSLFVPFSNTGGTP